MKQESKALVTGAAGKLAAFVSACERELTAEVVNGYLCDGFAELCRVLNGLRMENSDLETLAVAKQMEDSLMALDGCVARVLGRRGREPQRSFRRAAMIVGSVFKPGAFSAAGVPSVWKGKVTPETYRQMTWRGPPVQDEISCRLALSCVEFILAHGPVPA